LESSLNKPTASSLFDLDVKSVNVSVGTPPGMPPPLIPTISDLFATTVAPTTTTTTTDQLPGSGGDKKVSTTDTTADFADFSANFGDTSTGYVLVLNVATHILHCSVLASIPVNNFCTGSHTGQHQLRVGVLL